MKAAILKSKFNLTLEDVPMPILEHDQVLIRVKACGICGSDIHYFRGLNPWSLYTLGIEEPLPPKVILGHEVAGEIVNVGSYVPKSRIGERVGVMAFKPCGKCYYCRIHQYNLCAYEKHIGHDGHWGDVEYIPGGMAEFCPVWDDNAYPLPENISFEEGTQLDGLSVAVHAVRRSQLKVGDSVVVIGCGPIGLMILEVSKAFGALKLYAIDRWDKPLDVASKLGADGVINITKEDDPVKRIINFTKIGSNVVFDTVGSAKTIIEGLKMLRRGGVLVLLAGFRDSPPLHLKLLSGERVIMSSSNALPHDYHTAVSLLQSRRVKVKPFITHRLSLSEINKAFNIATNKEEYGALKVIVVP